MDIHEIKPRDCNLILLPIFSMLLECSTPPLCNCEGLNQVRTLLASIQNDFLGSDENLFTTHIDTRQMKSKLQQIREVLTLPKLEESLRHGNFENSHFSSAPRKDKHTLLISHYLSCVAAFTSVFKM